MFRGRIAAGLAGFVAAIMTIAGFAVVAQATPSCTDAWMGGSGLWSDGANWSEGVPPGSSDDACIATPGTYTVTLTDFDGGQGAVVKGLTLGGPSGTQTLVIEGEGTSSGGDWYNDTYLGLGSDGISIAPNAVLDLESTSTNTSTPPAGASSGGVAGLAMTNGEASNPIDNAGTINASTTDPAWGESMPEQGTMPNTGAINVQSGTLTMNGSPLNLTNTGSVDVSAAAELQLQGVNFDNESTVTNDGTILGYNVLGSSTTWTQTSGGVTGNPVQLGQGAELDDTAGAGTFDFDYRGGGYLSGTIPSGQTVTVTGSTFSSGGESQPYTNLTLGSDATGVPVAQTVTNDGTLVLDAPGSDSTGGSANLYGGELDNHGQFTSQAQDTTFTNTISNTLVNEADGAVSIASGTLYQAGIATTNDGATSISPGAVWTVQGGSFTNNGTLSPEIDGATSYGALNLEGALGGAAVLNAGGTLGPVLTGGYTPASGTEFPVIALSGGASVSGTFASVSSPFTADYSQETASPAYVGVVYHQPPPQATTLVASPQYLTSMPHAGIGLLHVGATLTAAAAPLAGQTVTFTAGKVTLCSAVTTASGVATCSVHPLDELAVLRSNRYTASFAGTASYLGSTATTPAITHGTGGPAARPANPTARIKVAHHGQHRHETLIVHISAPSSKTLTRTIT